MRATTKTGAHLGFYFIQGILSPQKNSTKPKKSLIFVEKNLQSGRMMGTRKRAEKPSKLLASGKQKRL
jgi:hypothetical protein